MRKFRFNIASLLAAILVLGVGFAGLRESSELWDSGLFTLTIGVLLVSILLAVHQTHKRRAFWLGFALSGSAYLALALMPSIGSRLITTKALAFVDSKLPGRPIEIDTLINGVIGSGMDPNQVALTVSEIQSAVAAQGQVRVWNGATGTPLGGWSGTTQNFIRIGHSLVALLAGLLGAQLSYRLYRAD
jgi:hypothetical protein